MVNKNVFKDAIKELYADNKKKGKEKGAMGTPRPRKQMIAIAFSKARRGEM
jgi:hypothetical protein